MIYTITLHCGECDYVECTICPQHKYITDTDKRGCIKQVSEELYVKYNNNINEILPFLHTYKNNQEIYKKIINDNYKVYESPTVKQINKSGNLYNFTSQVSI